MCFHDLVLDDLMVVVLDMDTLCLPILQDLYVRFLDMLLHLYLSPFCFCWLDCFVSNGIPLFCILFVFFCLIDCLSVQLLYLSSNQFLVIIVISTSMHQWGWGFLG